jgi:hypothetical protein
VAEINNINVVVIFVIHRTYQSAQTARPLRVQIGICIESLRVVRPEPLAEPGVLRGQLCIEVRRDVQLLSGVLQKLAELLLLFCDHDATPVVPIVNASIKPPSSFASS